MLIIINAFILYFETLFLFNADSDHYNIDYFKRSCKDKTAIIKDTSTYGDRLLKTETNTIYNGKVPDKRAAKSIAESTWLSMYGKLIYNEQPFIARVSNGKKWIVEGSLHTGQRYFKNGILIKTNVMLGGTAYIEIRISDGKILKVSHGK